jgi:hypothetical protein
MYLHGYSPRSMLGPNSMLGMAYYLGRNLIKTTQWKIPAECADSARGRVALAGLSASYWRTYG